MSLLLQFTLDRGSCLTIFLRTKEHTLRLDDTIPHISNLLERGGLRRGLCDGFTLILQHNYSRADVPHQQIRDQENHPPHDMRNEAVLEFVAGMTNFPHTHHAALTTPTGYALPEIL